MMYVLTQEVCILLLVCIYSEVWEMETRVITCPIWHLFSASNSGCSAKLFKWELRNESRERQRSQGREQQRLHPLPQPNPNTLLWVLFHYYRGVHQNLASPHHAAPTTDMAT